MNNQADLYENRPNDRQKRRRAQYGFSVIALVLCQTLILGCGFFASTTTECEPLHATRKIKPDKALSAAVANDHQGTTPEIVEELEQTDLFFARTSAGCRLFDRLRKEGQLLSPEEAKGLEEKLQLNPKDLPSRVTLMGYHKKIGGRHPPSMGPYGQLVLGMIEHHPRSKLSTATGRMLLQREGKMGDGEAWAQGSQLWRTPSYRYRCDDPHCGNQEPARATCNRASRFAVREMAFVPCYGILAAMA
jgi:hypothetical protein